MSTELVNFLGSNSLWVPEFDPASSLIVPGSDAALLLAETPGLVGPDYPGLVGPDGRELGIGYIRVSTHPQEKGTSPQNQKEGIFANAQRCNVYIPEEYLISETGSGPDFRRPGLQTVFHLIAGRKAKHFFAHDPDRVLRDPLYLVQFLRFCNEHDVTVHYSEGAVGKTVIDEAMQYLRGLVGSQEREKIAERTMDARRRVTASGRLPNGSGRGLYGYDYDPYLKVRTINEAEAAIVVEIYDRFLRGEAQYAIVRDLRERGIRTKAGYLVHPRTVHEILRNETYTGEHWWGTKRHEKLVPAPVDGPKRRVTPQPKDKWVRMVGFSPQIISPTMWSTVQEILDSQAGRGVLWDYLHSGFFFCAQCASRIAGATQQRKGIIYPYYRCTGTVPNYQRPKVCDLKAFRADKLEPVIWEHLRRIIEDPSILIDQLRAEVSSGDTDISGRISDLERRIRKCRREEAELHMKHVRQKLDDAMFEELIAPIQNLRQRLEEELTLLKQQDALAEGFEKLESQLAELCRQYSDRLDSLGRGEQRLLFRLFKVRLTGSPGRVFVSGILDPSLFTTGRTLECPSNWFYTVVLKPNPGKWPVIKLRSGRRKRPSS